MALHSWPTPVPPRPTISAPPDGLQSPHTASSGPPHSTALGLQPCVQPHSRAQPIRRSAACSADRGAQTIVLAAMVSIMAPARALRGPDGSLHDAVVGMQKWTSFVIVLFLIMCVCLSTIFFQRIAAASRQLS